MTLDEFKKLKPEEKLNEINRLEYILELTYSIADEGYQDIFKEQIKRLEREQILGYYYLYDNT